MTESMLVEKRRRYNIKMRWLGRDIKISDDGIVEIIDADSEIIDIPDIAVGLKDDCFCRCVPNRNYRYSLSGCRMLSSSDIETLESIMDYYKVAAVYVDNDILMCVIKGYEGIEYSHSIDIVIDTEKVSEHSIYEFLSYMPYRGRCMYNIGNIKDVYSIYERQAVENIKLLAGIKHDIVNAVDIFSSVKEITEERISKIRDSIINEVKKHFEYIRVTESRLNYSGVYLTGLYDEGYELFDYLDELQYTCMQYDDAYEILGELYGVQNGRWMYDSVINSIKEYAGINICEDAGSIEIKDIKSGEWNGYHIIVGRKDSRVYLGRYITDSIDNSIETEDYRELELFIREIMDGNW